MCKKVLINPETESFINDLKREYNNSIVKPYKKTRDVLEILMKKFVLYQKVWNETTFYNRNMFMFERNGFCPMACGL